MVLMSCPQEFTKNTHYQIKSTKHQVRLTNKYYKHKQSARQKHSLFHTWWTSCSQSKFTLFHNAQLRAALYSVCTHNLFFSMFCVMTWRLCAVLVVCMWFWWNLVTISQSVLVGTWLLSVCCVCVILMKLGDYFIVWVGWNLATVLVCVVCEWV